MVEEEVGGTVSARVGDENAAMVGGYGLEECSDSISIFFMVACMKMTVPSDTIKEVVAWP